jgi:hypothetical protein
MGIFFGKKVLTTPKICGILLLTYERGFLFARFFASGGKRRQALKLCREAIGIRETDARNKEVPLYARESHFEMQ